MVNLTTGRTIRVRSLLTVSALLIVLCVPTIVSGEEHVSVRSADATNVLTGSSREWVESLGEPYLSTAVTLPSGGGAGDDEGSAEGGAPSAECAAFAADINADVGDILRAGCKPSLAQMSKLMDNPLGNVAMLFTQIDLYKMENEANGKQADQWNYMGIAQFPKKLSDKWNLINRVVWNVPSVPIDKDNIDPRFRNFGNSGGTILPPAAVPAAIDVFSGRTTGFGDLYYVGLFSPADPIKVGNGSVVWGAGFDIGIPTATDDVLGTGRWTAGPSLLGVYLGSKWKIGSLVTHYSDFAGASRPDVNLTNIQYFVFYSLSPTLSVGAAPNIIANWENGSSDDVWTVPVGLGIAKTVNFGKVPVRIGFEAHYSVVQPDNVPGAEWDFRLYIIPAAPSALFKWMN